MITLDSRTPETPISTENKYALSHLWFAMICTKLVMIAWLSYAFEVETSLGLSKLYLILCFATPLHYLVNAKFKALTMPLAGMVLLFWLMPIAQALLFLMLFSLAFLPLVLLRRSNQKLLAIMTFALLLAVYWYYNMNWLELHPLTIPIIGSIFMFRAILYLFETRHLKQSPPFIVRLNYFFSLPNLVMPLFPVVDYKTFINASESKENKLAYSRGIRLLVRGLLHLLLYRMVYYFIQPNLSELATVGEVAMWMFTSYLLILRLSGLFHTAIGAICLLGFRLPVPFYNYFLASNFNDLWRRINTYWKDFVVKVLYFPAYFRFRKHGKTKGMVLSILLVFMVSWWFHSYQWFWIKGDFPLRWQDGVFWLAWGGLVIWASLKDAKKSVAQPHQQLRLSTLKRTVSIMIMLGIMTLLWAIWIIPNFQYLTRLYEICVASSFSDWLELTMAVVMAGLSLYVGLYFFDRFEIIQRWLEPKDNETRAYLSSTFILTSMTLLTFPAVLNIFQFAFDKPIEHIYQERLNEYDDALKIRGYYEDILSEGLDNHSITAQPVERQNWQRIHQLSLSIPTNDWREIELNPNESGLFKGAQFSINSQGLRDHEYDFLLKKGTIRFGIFGGSYVVGSGVEDDEVFENITEKEIEEKHAFPEPVEIINFSVPSYHLLQCLYTIEHRLQEFELTDLILVSHGIDISRMAYVIRKLRSDDTPMPYDFLNLSDEERTYIDTSSFNERREFDLERARMYTDSCYARVARLCSEKGITTHFLYWPRTNGEERSEELETIFNMVARYGFDLMDMSEVYDGYSQAQLTISEGDNHPNGLGHRLVAERFTNLLVEHLQQVKEQ